MILSDGETSDIFCISQHCKDIHEKNTECQILKIRLHLMMVRPRDDLSQNTNSRRGGLCGIVLLALDISHM